MLRDKIDKIVSLGNIIDGITLTDEHGIVQYYTNFRPDVNTLREQEIIGRSILEIYPSLNENSSSIMRVIKTGMPVKEYQTMAAYKKDPISGYNVTLPIFENKKLIGVVEFSQYCNFPHERERISISSGNTNSGPQLFTVDDIITESRAMTELKEKLIQSSRTDSTVLICGETGTGKELVAQSIHSSSPRKSKPFIAQNCAAIPNTLLEGILFGTSKGSYTDAIDRPGLFEIANGGTIFLDEINSMDLSLQAKILKAIEEKKTCRVGSFSPKSFDIKIVAALNKDPIQCIKDGTLREDLFYRLGVVMLSIPPLRERRRDIFVLTEYYIKLYNDIMNRSISGISPDVEDLFLNHNWPGNVRELKNCIEGAFNVCRSRIIELRDLPAYIRDYDNSVAKRTKALDTIDSEQINLSEMVDAYEKSLILRCMEETNNMAEVAKKLGISRQSLKYKTDKYGI